MVTLLRTSAFGKSVFIVTPKGDQRTSVREALAATRGEIAFGICLGAVSLYLTSSVLPVALIACPAVFCFYLAFKHNGASLPSTPKPELPAAVIRPARTAAEERAQLAMLETAGPDWSAELDRLAREDRQFALASQGGR